MEFIFFELILYFGIRILSNHDFKINLEPIRSNQVFIIHFHFHYYSTDKLNNQQIHLRRISSYLKSIDCN